MFHALLLLLNFILCLNLFSLSQESAAFYLKIFPSISEALRRYIDNPDFSPANA